ncbi:MAG: hypothetical protein QOH96_1330, partial [Blastocatellia bacterium]|nr:hypothetical protein [Blastocatellia bacterium]
MKLLRPGNLMLAVWMATVLLFYLSPISYAHAPGLAAWSIIGGGILLFYLGALTAGRAMPRGSQAADYSSPDKLIVF